MVHKEQYQKLADAAAVAAGCYALHIGKIGEDTFVYSMRTGDSSDFDPDCQTLITVCGDDVKTYAGDEAQAILAETTLREFGTGRAIYKKYQTLVKNHSSIIGEPPGYAQAIVDAVATKAVKPSVMYQYLELAEHYHKKLRITGGDISLYSL